MEEIILPVEEAVKEEKRGITTSRLWYAALVPLFGIYLEIFANSLELGLLVWGLALVMGPAACLLDYRFLEKKGIYSPQLRPAYALFPPLYIVKRTKLTGDSPVCGIVWCILFVFALAANDFTRALTLTESDMTGAISEGYWSCITETANVSCDKTIGESLEEMAGCTLEWSGARGDGCLSVSCKGENGFMAKFRIDHDGYVAGNYHLIMISIDGSAYDGEDAADLIRERYPSDSGSSEEESSSEADVSGEEDESAAA